jgi:hypothetical protein
MLSELHRSGIRPRKRLSVARIYPNFLLLKEWSYSRAEISSENSHVQFSL